MKVILSTGEWYPVNTIARALRETEDGFTYSPAAPEEYDKNDIADVPEELVSRYMMNLSEFDAIQEELEKYLPPPVDYSKFAVPTYSVVNLTGIVISEEHRK